MVLSVLFTPPGDTHRPVTSFTSVAVRLSPCSRFCCAPRIETIPNTAIAPIAAMPCALTRVVGSRRAIRASLVEAAPKGFWRMPNAAMIPLNKIGSRHRSAMSRVTTPATAACGRKTRIRVVIARHTPPATSCAPVVQPLRPLSTGGCNGRMSVVHSGASIPTNAARIPKPTASAIVGNVTTLCEPTGNAKDR